MKKTTILWVDDEIDLLKPHIIFLENKGYEVETATNGDDAIDLVQQNQYSIIFLDENMPGLSGLETLSSIKDINSNVPVVMITKSEEEYIMDEAIGSKMADYLIKPVNPKQILLSIKKNVNQKELVTQKTTSAYQSEFMKLGTRINDSFTHEDWKEVYKKLVYWELELGSSDNSTMDEVLKMQKSEANNAFTRFVKKNYLSWLNKDNEDKPLISPDVVRQKVIPLLEKGKKVFFLVIDNLRFDQWKALSPIFNEYYDIVDEDLYYSILPTATMYARNSLFAGLMPTDIKKVYPQYWLDDDNEDGGKNNFESELFQSQLNRFGRKESVFFDKITNIRSGKKSIENINQIKKADLAVMVFNFIDMLSHSRTEMEMLRELACDEPAYRSITVSWFKHSALFELIRELSTTDYELIITTDHGSIQVENAKKVIAERSTNTNLRYKHGRNLNYTPKEVYEVHKPEQAHIPSPNVSSTFIFATGKDFFVYPNNYNQFVNYYKNTFQHGGISLEEMIIPLVHLRPK